MLAAVVRQASFSPTRRLPPQCDGPPPRLLDAARIGLPPCTSRCGRASSFVWRTPRARRRPSHGHRVAFSSTRQRHPHRLNRRLHDSCDDRLDPRRKCLNRTKLPAIALLTACTGFRRSAPMAARWERRGWVGGSARVSSSPVPPLRSDARERNRSVHLITCV